MKRSRAVTRPPCLPCGDSLRAGTPGGPYPGVTDEVVERSSVASEDNFDPAILDGYRGRDLLALKRCTAAVPRCPQLEYAGA